MEIKDCLDCAHCVIEDLWNEVCCYKDKHYKYIGEDNTIETAKNCEHYKKE